MKFINTVPAKKSACRKRYLFVFVNVPFFDLLLSIELSSLAAGLRLRPKYFPVFSVV